MENDQPNTQEQITVEYSPLYLPIEDVALISTLDNALLEATQERRKYDIDGRAKVNNRFWQGNQVNDDAIDKRYQMAHTDNVIYPDLENRIMLAAGRIPEIILTPPDSAQGTMEAVRSLQQVIRERVNSGVIKRLIKDGLRNLHTDFIGIIKPIWNPNLKDYRFDLILSENVLFSKGSKVPHDGYSIDASDIVLHWVEEPLKVVLAKFPGKKNELMQLFAKANSNAKTLPSHIRYLEAQFTYYDEEGNAIEGVAWKYQNLILDKMRQPYFDYKNKERNFFDRPHKTYILFSYQNRGRMVYDSTTTVEQSVPINRVVNKRLRQITEIADRSVPKLAFRGGAISAEMARNISTSPKEAIVLTSETEDIRREMAIIPSQPPNRILYEDLMANRSRIDAMMATHGTTRGEGGSESGVSKQISREGDLVTSDDLVDVVVERVVYEMACWALQFMRLYFEDDRDPERMVDKNGDTSFVKLSRPTINTKVSVVVKASTTDKQTRRADAVQMLESKTIDPYTLFEDLDVPNPKERLKRLLSFQMAAATGGTDFTAYLKTLGISLDEADDQAEAARAQADIAALEQGQEVPMDKAPSQAYLTAFVRYVNSADFANLAPEIQQLFAQHIQQLKAMFQQQAQAQVAATTPAPQMGAPEAGAPPAPQPQPAPQPTPQPQPQPAPGGAY